MKKFAFIFLGLFCLQLQAQQFRFSTGTNYTEFDYENSANQSDLNLSKGRGNFYEWSFVNAVDSSEVFSYQIGLVYNEFNAKGGNLLNMYSWSTGYLGLKAGLSCAIITSASGFRTALNVGLNGNSLVTGSQSINGLTNNLKDQQDFSGLFIETSFGIDLSTPLTDKTRIGVGYQYSKNGPTSKESGESLAFTNHQIQFNLQFNLKKNEKESADITTVIK
jgi:hypothetical protein